MITWTGTLRALTARDLQARARAAVANVPADLLARTAAFLLLKDSKSSFAIENENPPHDRIQRWGRAIGEAGRRPIDLDELLRLQRIVIGDARFVRLGLRDEGGFVGQHDRDTRTPLPDHISARPEDLRSLMEGLVAFDRSAAPHLDPVLAAAALAFGFVYIHPFADGNGRLHRYLIHHVLAERGFNPPGLVFPVSAVILDRIDDYRRTLESYSARLLPMIEWEPTPDGNVRVLDETADFYRFFDATPHAEFLYECVERTIDVDLPTETRFLKAYDAFRREVANIVDMPDRTADLLFRFLHQNSGTLSVFALFDEYQSKENAKHTLRAMQENARQGFWNGSKAPYGYAVVAAEQRGAKTKKRLAIDPVEAEAIRLIFRLFREGDGASGPMGVKATTSWLNEHGYRTRTGARWGIRPTARDSDARHL
jgi:hypothetical protein